MFALNVQHIQKTVVCKSIHCRYFPHKVTMKLPKFDCLIVCFALLGAHFLMTSLSGEIWSVNLHENYVNFTTASD